ncbi:helix-turn-helix domain-containing protein [Anaerosporobacter faecicola]|uniref:helix-turn-helix domain-containing protein n=1 Tax=Anaerosporobacter faecicola TaxID=2718714 RepID=UPI00143AF63B|nr:AraC family transcriptional regulator [Anaerosporobacter faecicola]
MIPYNNFLSSIIAYSKLPEHLDLDFLIPVILKASTNSFSSVLAGCKEVSLTFPFYCESKGCPYYILLYTKTGQGSIQLSGHSYPAKVDTLLFFSCEQPFKICSFDQNWTFQILYLNQGFADLYYQIFHQNTDVIYEVKSFSCVPFCFHNLLKIDEQMNLSSIYEMKWITDILTELCIYVQTKDNPDDSIPYYVKKLKERIDEQLQESISLEAFAEELKVNKYRLCREFSQFYHMPPLHYRNHMRIEKAKELLFTTNLTITEISLQLGIENVTHFINLFKKETGATPLVFRQEAPESIRNLYRKDPVS